MTRCIALVAVALAGVAFGACALTQKPAPKATLAATVAPTATVPANALLDDPLTDNHNDWATNDIGCSFGADGFHVMAPNEHYQICGAPMGPLTNGVVTVTVQQLTGVLNGPYGIIFRGSTTLGALDDNTFYWFAINGQGAWALFRQNGSTVTQLSAFTINGAIHTGLKQKNTLSVQFRGQTFTCAINGVGVGVVTDPGSKLTDGGVGLAAGGADAVFTDFVATS